jgi:hypothetical protein
MSRPSLAEQYRAHREAFLLALELGVTPREAEAEMRRQRAREKWRAGMDRLEARMNAPIGVDTFGTSGSDERDPQPWMMRD